MGKYKDIVREMSDEELDGIISKGFRSSSREGFTTRMPKMPMPRITTAPLGRPERLTLGEELIRRIEIGEDPQEVYLHVLNKGTRSPGARKKPVMDYLNNELKKAKEEGRI